jgi:hypothetical protein
MITMQTLITSPFEPIFRPFADQLPESIRAQYLLPAGSKKEIVLGGKMDRIWRRPSWLWPIFWLLAKWNIFYPEVGTNVPTVLTINSKYIEDQVPIQIWQRTFHFPGSRRRYLSTMLYNSKISKIIELQGPGNRFHEVANVSFSPPGTIEFLTIHSTLRLGPLKIPLSPHYWITAHVVQKADPERDDRSSVNLTVTHPWFGPIFGYEGTFTTTIRKSRGSNAE